MSFDGTKQQALSGKAMASSSFVTQGTTDEHTPCTTCDDKISPTKLDKTAPISGTGLNLPSQCMPDDIQHGLGDHFSSTTDPAESANDLHQIQMNGNGNELIEDDNRLRSEGQTAEEQNLEVDVSYALLSCSYKGPFCHTKQTLTVLIERF